MKSLNLPALISSELARQIVLEMKWNITGKAETETDEEPMNPRAEYLKAEFEKLIDILRLKPVPDTPCLFFPFLVEGDVAPTLQ